MSVHDTTHFNELLVSNRANGYRDLLAVIDLSTYRRLSWEKNLPFFLVSFIVPETGEWLSVDPRSALKLVLDKAEEKGWTCMSGAEFEVSVVSRRKVGGWEGRWRSCLMP
jgi:glutamine synthetase